MYGKILSGNGVAILQPGKANAVGTHAGGTRNIACHIQRVAFTLGHPQPQVLALAVGLVPQNLADHKVFRTAANDPACGRPAPGKHSVPSRPGGFSLSRQWSASTIR